MAQIIHPKFQNRLAQQSLVNTLQTLLFEQRNNRNLNFVSIDIRIEMLFKGIRYLILPVPPDVPFSCFHYSRTATSNTP
jgi:hypothetical protein